MDTIISGRFDTLAQAQQAEAMLIGREFTEDDICSFALNPPGQHDADPVGGDGQADDNSRQAGPDTAKGSAIGLGAGLAAVAVAVPAAGVAVAVVAAAAGVGAYTGSLAGALHGMGPEQQKTTGKTADPRPAGVLIAVRAADDAGAQSAQEALQSTGARDIEIAAGIWRDGSWADFDPQSTPHHPSR